MINPIKRIAWVACRLGGAGDVQKPSFSGNVLILKLGKSGSKVGPQTAK